VATSSAPHKPLSEPDPLTDAAEAKPVDEGRPGRINSGLIEWARWVLEPSDQSPALHHRFLLTHLEAVSQGTIDRLMVLMPPGSAKSTYAYVNTDLWGAYVTTPAPAGIWYAWVEGTDGSQQSVYPIAFTVS
jgi:hypothetical protein